MVKGKKCFAPSKTGEFCWMQNFPVSKCRSGKGKKFYTIKTGKNEVRTMCLLKKPIPGPKGGQHWAAQRVGKRKLGNPRNDKCPRPSCKRGKFA